MAALNPYRDQIFSHATDLYNKKFDWPFIVDLIWLVWHTYITHLLTHWLTDSLTHWLTDSLTHWLTDLLIHWPVHNILDAPTKRYFLQKNNSKKLKCDLNQRLGRPWFKVRINCQNGHLQFCDILRIWFYFVSTNWLDRYHHTSVPTDGVFTPFHDLPSLANSLVVCCLCFSFRHIPQLELLIRDWSSPDRAPLAGFARYSPKFNPRSIIMEKYIFQNKPE